MPAVPFRKAIAGHDPGLAAITAVADLSGTSLTATAIRYAELSESAVVVIMSTGGVIDHCFLSEAMKSMPKRDWLRKGSPLPAGTVTACLAADPARVLSRERAGDNIEVRDWLGGTKSAAASEEAIGLGSYGKILTIIAAPRVGMDEDQEGNEEADLVESCRPRFRR